MAKLFIKKGDNVVVLAGKDKGKTGKVLEVSPETNRAVVENVNIVTKHKKAKSAQEKGGIIKKPAALDASNLMVICSACGKATRIARKEIDGKNVRVCKKCGVALDKAYVKPTKKEAKKAEPKEVKQEKTQEVKKQPVKTAPVKAKKADVKTAKTSTTRKTGGAK